MVKAGFRRMGNTAGSVALVFLLVSCNVLLVVPSSVEAGPIETLDGPTLGELQKYWFYDGFEYNLTNWVVTGDVRLQEDIVYGKGQAALLPSSSSISRSLVGDSQEVVIEAWFYDNGPESKNEVSAYLYAANASNEVRVGVDTSLSQWQYFADFGEKPMLLDAKRYEGWHMLRLHLIENVTVVAIDQMEIAKFPLSAPTRFGARSDVGEFYVDEVMMWSLYRASVWDYKPVEIIPKGYDKWNEGAIWDSKTLYNKADGSFKMFFLAYDGVGQYSLGYAVSVDGYSWIYSGFAPPLTFKFEPLGMDIMLYEGVYYLYASDGDGIYWFQSSDPLKEGSWSDMGQVLTKGSPGDMDSGRIDALSIVADPGGAYFLVYSAWSEKFDYPRLFLAKAPDGVHWEKAQRDPVFDLGQLTDGPDIEVIDGMYYIWFHTSAWNETIQSTQYSVYCIMSKDLFTWEKAPQYAQLMAVSPEKGDYKTFGNMYPNPVNTTHGSYLYYTYDVNGARSIYMQSSDYHILDVAQGNVIQYGNVYVKEANCSVAPDGVITYTKGDPLVGTAIPDFKPVPDNSSVEVKMSYWNPMIVDKSKTELMAKWNATSESPNTVTFSMFAPIYRKYIFTVDGKDVSEVIPDENGIISFTYSGPWTTHEFGTKGGAPTLSGNTRTWNAASLGALASVAASWTPAIVPTNGDHIVFDGTSIKTCTWDIGATGKGDGKKFGYFTIAAAYGSRLITQTAPQLNITKMQVDAGKFSWDGKRMVCYRDFNVTVLNAWIGAGNLTMQGNNDGVTRQLRYTSSNIGFLGGLVIGDNTSLYGSITAGTYSLIVNGTGGGSNVNVVFNITTAFFTVDIQAGKGTAGQFINYGWIKQDVSSGQGVKLISRAGTQPIMTDWGAKGRNFADLVVEGTTSLAPTTFNQVGPVSARNFQVNGQTVNYLTAWNTNNYRLYVTGNYKAFDWSTINLGSSNVYVGGNFQASDPADTDTMTYFQTSTVWAMGDTTYTSRPTYFTMYNLVVNSTKYWRCANNMVFNGYLSIQGSFLNIGGTATAITVDRATFGLEFMGNGTWDIPVYLDPTGRNGHKIWVAASMGGTVAMQKPTDIYIGSTTVNYLNWSSITGGVYLNFTLKSWTPSDTSWISRWYAAMTTGGSVRFNQKLSPSTVYDWYIDTVPTSSPASTSLGWLNITYNSWSTHEFATGKPTTPVITSSPVTQAYEDKAYSYTATCDQGEVTWALEKTNASGWLTFTPANATAWGRPNNLYAHKSYYVNITATKAGKTGYQNYTVSVQNKKPAFTTTAPIGVWKTKVYTYDAEVDDQSPYGGTFGATISTNWTGAYTYTQSTGTLSFTASKSGYFWFNMTFNDNTGATNATTYQNFTIYVATPFFTSSPVTQAYEDKAYSYQPTVNTTVTTWGYTTNGSAWINQNGGTGQIYGTPTNLYAGRYYWVNISAATTNDGTVYQNYTVSVQNKKPLFTSTPTTGVWKSKPYSYDAEVDDQSPYGGTFDATIKTNLSVSYTYTQATGVISFTTTKSGYFWFNMSFNDNSHTANATNYQNWTVYVWTPYFTSSPVTTAYEDKAYSYQATVNTTVTTWGWTTNGSAWLSHDGSGKITGNPSNLYAGRFYWVNITATTTNDGTIWQNYTVSVQNKKPAFTSTPSYGVWFSKPYSYSATVDDWTPYGGTFDGTIKTNWTASYTWTAGTGSLTWTATLKGYFWFNVTFNDNSHTVNATTYQNWTVYIAYPYFTSTPITSAWEDHGYSYTPTVNTSVSTWGHTTNAAWVSQNPSTGEIYGTPVNTYSEQSYWVNISAVTVNDGTVYQNYTVFVHNYRPQFTTTPMTGTGHRWTYYYNVSFDDWAVGGSITGLTTNLSVSYSWSTSTGKLQFTADYLGYFWFNISVTDNTGVSNQTNYQNWTVTVWAIVTFTSTPLTSSWEDHLYSYSTTTNRSISSWYLDSNATWLSIDGSGVVSGTPDNLNSMYWYYVHVRATCAAGFEWQNFTVTVVNYIPHITSTPVAQVWYHYIFFYDPLCDDEGAQGGVYLTVYTNYSGSYSFWTNNGTLMFNASYHGQFWFNITFSDQSGAANQTTFQNFTLTIASNAPAFTSTALLDAWEDHFYSYQATCNQTVVTWGFSSNASWLSDGSGLVTGTPDNTNSMHWYWVSVSATNWRGTRYQNYTVTVANNITYFTTMPITGVYFWSTYYYNASFEDLTIGGSFSGLMTNFTNPYSWTVGNGKLQLLAASVGYYWFNITVTDGSGAANQTTYQNWTLYIVYAVVFTNSPNTGAWEDHFYHYDPTVNRTGVTWSLTTNASFLSWNGGATRVEGTPDNLYSEKSFWFNVTVHWGVYVNWLNLTNFYVYNNPPTWQNSAGDLAYLSIKYYYNASVDDDGIYGGLYTGVSTNLTESYNWTASTGQLNFTSEIEGFYYFNITFDDNSGAGNATIYYNWTLEVRLKHLITSLAITDAWEDVLYYYAIGTKYTPCIFWLTSDADFLSVGVITGILQGTANNTHSGQTFNVSIKAQYGAIIDYQNWTLTVYNRMPEFTTTPSTVSYYNGTYTYYCDFDDFGEGGFFDWISTNYTGDYDFWTANGTLQFKSLRLGMWQFTIYVDDGTTAANSTNSQYWVLTIMMEFYINSTAVTNSVEDHAYDYAATLNKTLSGVVWSLKTNCSVISINPSTGQLSGLPDNYEANKHFYVNVTARHGVHENWQNFSLYVINVKPEFTTVATVTEIYREKTFYYNASFDDKSYGGSFVSVTTNFTGTYSWTASTGKLYWSSTVVGEFWWNITVSDNSNAVNATNYQNFSVEVIWAFVFTSTPVTTAWEDHLYEYEVTTNDTIDSWAIITSPHINDWLSFHSDKLRGIPDDRSSQQSFIIKITGYTTNGSVWQQFSIFVYNNPPVWSSTPPTTGNAGVSFTYPAQTSDSMWGGHWSFTSNSPFGGTISIIGVFIVTPTGAGTFWFNIRYMDEGHVANSTINQNFTVVFAPTGGGGGGAPLIVANFEWNITSLGKVIFIDTSTGTNIVTWTWNFGDGVTSNLQNPTHTYKKVGTYSVMLTIEDSVGRTASVTKQVIITEVGQASLIPSSMMTILPMVIIVLGLLGALGGRTEAGRIASIVVILAGLLLFLMGYV